MVSTMKPDSLEDSSFLNPGEAGDTLLASPLPDGLAELGRAGLLLILSEPNGFGRTRRIQPLPASDMNSSYDEDAAAAASSGDGGSGGG